MKLKRSNKKLKNNILYSSFYQILVFVVPIITTPYITRIFNVAQMGEYSLSLSLSTLFVIVSQFGIDTYGTREIAKQESSLKRDQLFFQLLSIQLSISLLIFVVFNFFFLYVINIDNKQLYFIQSLLILANIFDISWFFIGIEEIQKTILRNVLMKFFTTISILFFIKYESQLNFYALLNIIGMLIGNLTMIVLSKQYIDYRNIKYSLSKLHLKGSFILLIPRLLNNSYITLENSVLKISTTSDSLGVYSQAKKINNLIFSVINSAIIALSPRMSYYVSTNDVDNINNIFNKGLKYSSAFSLIFVSGIFAVSDYFVDFFFGSGYEMVSPVLKVISISLILVPLIVLINIGILIPYNKDREYSISILIILMSGVISNIILDPFLGAIGAAISYNITQLISFLYLLYVVRNLVIIKDVLRYILLSFIFIFININIINLIKAFIYIENSFLSFVIFGVISIIVNLIFLVLLKLLSKSSNFN